VKFEAESHGWAMKPRTQGGAPRIARRGGVRKLEARAFGSARRLEASIMCGICPVEATKGRTGGV